MKNLAADSKIGPPLKIDFRADWTHEFNPTAWELNSVHAIIQNNERQVYLSPILSYDIRKRKVLI